MVTELKKILSIPRFRISIADLPLTGELSALVNGITFTDSVEKMPKLIYTLEDKIIHIGSGARGRLIDTNAFSQGTDTDLWLGYGKDLPYIGHFKITQLAPQFTQNGVKYNVTAHGLEWLLNRSESESWIQFGIQNENKTTTDAIIREVLSKYYPDYAWDFSGLKRPIKKVEAVKEANITDLEFFYRMAKRDGYRFWIENKAENVNGKFKIKHIVNWQPIAYDRTSVATLRYNSGQKSNLVSFNPKINMKQKGSKLQVVAWDSKENKIIIAKQEIVLKGDEQNMKRYPDNVFIKELKTQITAWDLVPQAATLQYGGYVITQINDGSLSEDEVKKYAERIFAKMKSEWIIADGLAFGNPYIRAGKIIEIENVGKLYSGPYFIFKSQHKVTSSKPYTTRFTARKLVEI